MLSIASPQQPNRSVFLSPIRSISLALQLLHSSQSWFFIPLRSHLRSQHYTNAVSSFKAQSFFLKSSFGTKCWTACVRFLIIGYSPSSSFQVLYFPLKHWFGNGSLNYRKDRSQQHDFSRIRKGKKSSDGIGIGKPLIHAIAEEDRSSIHTISCFFGIVSLTNKWSKKGETEEGGGQLFGCEQGQGLFAVSPYLPATQYFIIVRWILFSF